MTWKIPRIWDGGDVWIIGGGPSIVTQFNIPAKVVQAVNAGSKTPDAYSPYMSSIHNKHTIGINAAYLLGNWVDFVFFADSGFFLKNKLALSKTQSMISSCHPTTKKYPWIKFLDKDRNHIRGISMVPGKVSWNKNSGAASISLAAQLGAKRIYLLGFDMKLDENSQQHWHNEYEQADTIRRKNPLRLPFDRHLPGFAQIKKDAITLGIEIINVNPDSAIKEFKKVSLSEILSLGKAI